MNSLTLPPAKLRHLLSLADGATFVDRVPMKPQPPIDLAYPKPPHAPGDVVYVKESIYIDDYRYSDGGRLPKEQGDILPEAVYYRVDGTCCEQIPECCCAEVGKPKWHKASQMPEWAARLFVRVVSVRPERVQDVTEEDARLEGFSPEYDRSNDDAHKSHLMAMEQFWYAWDARNPKHPFDSNPHVWRYEFVKTTGGES